jgi:hypothetical protein
MVGSLDSKETKFLFHSHSNAIYASGHVLFLRQNTLMAQRFDTKHLEVTIGRAALYRALRFGAGEQNNFAGGELASIAEEAVIHAQ